MNKDLTVQRPNPQKIETFDYSGDLRVIPEIDEDQPLYEYRDLTSEIGDNEALQKLSSIKFAKPDEKDLHKRELIQDRIVELFGTDSELEQTIALLTFSIRKMIPRAVKLQRRNKGLKRELEDAIKERYDLLTSLREMDHERFEWLLRELKIQYVIPKEPEPVLDWKEVGRRDKRNQALEKQREKLEALRVQFEEEKEAFSKHKADILKEIDRDLQKFGLDRDFLENILKREAEKREEVEKDTMTWEERAKIGMIEVTHLFPPKPVDPRLAKKYKKFKLEMKKR